LVRQKKSMIKFPSKFFSKLFPTVVHPGYLGVDIGTSSIKIVELAKTGMRVELKNYGETSVLSLYEKQFRTFEKSTLLLSSRDIARAIRAILEEAKIQTKFANFSIPDFSSFFTTFEIPAMSEKELPQAIRYEAPQHIPLPLGEVTIDWQIIRNQVARKKGERLKILLVAVTNEIIGQYRDIAQMSGLQLENIEAEVFCLARALAVKGEKGTVGLVDIGAQSTSCSIINNGILKSSHSFDTAGNVLTQMLSQGLQVDYQKAEKLKRKYGLISSFAGDDVSSRNEESKEVAKTLIPSIDLILTEIERTFQEYSREENKEIDKVILAGGTALLPGLKEHITSFFNKKTEIINPFSEIFYHPTLEESLKEMGPSYAIAVGIALRSLEQ